MKRNSELFLIISIIGLSCFLTWKFSGIALSQEMPPDYSVFPHPTENTDKERLVYLFLSMLLSGAFYTPFYLSEKYTESKVTKVGASAVLFFTILLNFISSNTKGLLLSNWFGEDYGFTVNLLLVFLLAPFVFFYFNKFAQIKLPARSLIYLFLMSFVIYYLSKFTGGVIFASILTSIRKILTDGYFIFFYVIAFGLVGYDANRKQRAKNSSSQQADSILDSNMDHLN